MTHTRRNLFLMVIGDCQTSEMLRFAHLLETFRHIDPLLTWLVRNKITGQKFINWVNFEHCGCVFAAGRTVLEKLHHPVKMIDGYDVSFSGNFR